MGYQKLRGVFRPPQTPPAIAEMAGNFTGKIRESVAETDKRLAEINDAIVAGRPSNYRFRRLKREQGELLERQKSLNAELERISRLANDPRMRKVYELLEAEGFDDNDWRLFFYAVLSVPTDRYFREIRSLMKEALSLSREIAETAEKLAGQIKRLEALKCGIPYELVSTQALLKQSDSSFPAVSDEWERLRPYLLEQLPDSDDEVRHAWESAPGLTDLLAAVARLCREFEPRPRIAAAAVRSRKRGDKAEPIRALAETLTKYCGFKLTPRLKRAIALTLTTDFDDPDDEVSYEHVREVVAGLQPVIWSKSPKPTSQSDGE